MGKSKEAASGTNAAAAVPSAHDLERIRQIIFGSQMRQIEQRFTTQDRDIARLEKEIASLQSRLADHEAQQTKDLQALRQEIREFDDELRQQLHQLGQHLEDEKMDRVSLGELFIEMGTQVKSGGSLADLLNHLSHLDS